MHFWKEEALLRLVVENGYARFDYSEPHLAVLTIDQVLRNKESTAQLPCSCRESSAVLINHLGAEKQTKNEDC